MLAAWNRVIAFSSYPDKNTKTLIIALANPRIFPLSVFPTRSPGSFQCENVGGIGSGIKIKKGIADLGILTDKSKFDQSKDPEGYLRCEVMSLNRATPNGAVRRSCFYLRDDGDPSTEFDMSTLRLSLSWIRLLLFNHSLRNKYLVVCMGGFNGSEQRMLREGVFQRFKFERGVGTSTLGCVIFAPHPTRGGWSEQSVEHVFARIDKFFTW